MRSTDVLGEGVRPRKLGPPRHARTSSGSTRRDMSTYLGVTPPISLNGPTEKDIEMTKTLEEELRAHNVFESTEEAKLRCV